MMGYFEVVASITKSTMTTEEKTTALNLISMVKDGFVSIEYKLDARNTILEQLGTEGKRAGEIVVKSPYGRKRSLQYVVAALREMTRMGIVVREVIGTEMIEITKRNGEKTQIEVDVPVFKKAEWAR